MSVEVIKPVAPTAEITRLPVLPQLIELVVPGPEIIVASIKTISLSRPAASLAERIAEKTPSPATPTAIRDIISRGSERLRYYRRGRRPRCPHGKRRGDASHQCGDGIFGSTPLMDITFKFSSRKLFNLNSKSSGLY